MQHRQQGLGLTLLGFMLLAAGGCGDKDKGGDIDAGTDSGAVVEDYDSGILPDGAWATLHEAVFVPNGCDNTFCHGAAGMLNLTVERGYDELVDVPAKGEECGKKTTKLRVKPGDPDASLLLEKLGAPSCGERMPVGLPKLSSADVELVRKWIEDGAPKN